MKMIVMALGALIILGGGGAGAYFYFMNPAEASATEEAKEKAAEKESKDKHEKKHFEFVELDPLLLPVMNASGVSQTVNLVVTLEVPDADAKHKVEMIAPRLSDAYIQELYSVLNKHAATSGGALEIGKIKARLNAISTKVAGEGVISDVLLQVIQQRPI